ncbi:MAG: C4-dicarboxylate transporter DcuC [Bacteroidales bacterium]
MIYIGAIISIQFIILTAYWLMKKNNPQAVLITTGLLMLIVSLIIGLGMPELSVSTGSIVFDLFKTIKDTFSTNMLRVGLMIMTIGGYVAYMKQIKASDALVYVSMQPLSFFNKFPYLAASLVIPIGQLLFICTPSAAGLGLLLVASIYPVLVGLGISRLSALSVIAACTVFDMGPGSANTARASELIEQNNVLYFVEHQLPLAIPMTILLMVLYYFSNRYFDKKDKEAGKFVPEVINAKKFKVDVPLIYAILPVLPLAMLVVFSKYIQLFDPPIELDTTTAMFVSLFIAMGFELIRNRSIHAVFNSVKSFWNGMGNVFSSVVTLIVAAEIFSKGLISLGFIDALVEGSGKLGFSGIGVAIIITIIIFMAAMLMGSGNASFFSFGPLVPSIAGKLGVPAVDMILPMQLSASMGRAVSPIAGVIIAIAEVAGVSPMDLAKRNAIPLGGALIFLIVYHFFFMI